MSNIYEKYLLYSSKYFLISGINNNDNEETIKKKSYYILNKSSPQEYIDHNLNLATLLNDTEYFEYINLIKQPTKKLVIKLKDNVQSISNILNISILKEIYKYIYDNHLQDKEDRRIIRIDEYLKSKLKPLDKSDNNYTYYNISRYLNV
jgi:hypothetical protein